MIYITGDTHADFSRFKNPMLRKLKKQDALIICGDFGFIWDGSPKEQKLLTKIGKLPYNVLFVEGTHENYDLLEQYEVSEWCGGKTRLISGRLRQLMRGQLYEIAGRTVFTFGGGQTDEELAEGIDNLNRTKNSVDFVVTYEPPSRLQEFLTNNGQPNHINTYLNEIYEKVDFESWFFGKLHLNKLIPPKYYAVYDGIIAADITKIKKTKPSGKPKKSKESAEAEIAENVKEEN